MTCGQLPSDRQLQSYTEAGSQFEDRQPPLARSKARPPGASNFTRSQEPTTSSDRARGGLVRTTLLHVLFLRVATLRFLQGGSLEASSPTTTTRQGCVNSLGR
jgi:hypothetical protein